MFVHLHCHSTFSLLDGAAAPVGLTQRAAEWGMPAVAVTDHNTLAGAVRFYQAARSAGIKPIIGVEFTVELVGDNPLPVLYPPGGRGADRLHSPRPDTTTDYTQFAHLVLLARDNEGYANLCRLVTCARLGKARHSGPFADEYAQLDRKRPVLTQAHLRQHASHLICLSGCEKGQLPRLVAAGKRREALAVADYYRQLFGDDSFYVEIHNNLLPLPDRGLRYRLQGLADELGLRVVATNNVHYVDRTYARAQDLLVCMRALQTVHEYHPDRKLNAEYSLKPAHEMAALFPDQPTAIHNALEIAAQCNWTLDLETFHFPRFDLQTVGAGDEPGPATATTHDAVPALRDPAPPETPPGLGLVPAPRGGEGDLPPAVAAGALRGWPVPRPAETTAAYLRRMCDERAEVLYPTVDERVRARIEHELQIITDQGLCDYFLIVWDICRFSRARGIMTTGRGSAGDSIVSYLLGITAVDPLAHDLLFERFLNPQRRQMPDIDVDFDSRRRDEVTAYVYRRYGAVQVAAVCTINTFRARSAVREVGKALGMDEEELDTLSKTLPHIRAADIAQAAERFPEVREARLDLSNKGLLLELCEQISGFPRHLSVHVGGLVIGAEPLTNLVSLVPANKGIVICEFDKDDVEALGLVKMDILGLRTHTAISDCLDLIARRTGVRIDLARIALDDRRAFELLRSTQTIGLFQLESPGQRNLLGRAQPREFEEVIANISLFRPGPVQSDMIKPYLRRKHGLEPVSYPHPALEPIMRRTWGVLIYQEQVLEIAAAIAGFSLGEADQLRRLMTSDRSHDEMMKLGGTFIDKAVARGVTREVAEEVFRQISGFAAYGFCKAHAACFALISFQTAWLKAHYPAEFFAGILSAQPMGFYPSRTVAEEARRLGCGILPPCVNHSEDRFAVEGNDIRVGLRLLRGMSAPAMRSILQAREQGGPFQSLRDFCERTAVPRPLIENLILARGFAFTGYSEQELLWLLSALPRQHLPRGGRDQAGPGVSGDTGPRRPCGNSRRHAAATLFEPPAEAILETLPELNPTTPVGRVALDLNLCAVSTTVNPFSFWRARMQRMGVTPTTSLYQCRHGDSVRVAGIVIARARPPTRSGKTAIFISLEDEFGLVDVAVFEECYQRCGRALYASPVLCVEGKLTRLGTLDLSVTAQHVIGMGSWRDFERPLPVRAGPRPSRSQPAPNPPVGQVHGGHAYSLENKLMDQWEPRANPKVGDRRG